MLSNIIILTSKYIVPIFIKLRFDFTSSLLASVIEQEFYHSTSGCPSDILRLIRNFV